MNFKKGLLSGDVRALARILTLIENEETKAVEVIKSLYYKGGNAYVIGITGPPGSGKSTLTDKMVKHLREQNKTVGIIAVDPTSPFTGGAILGDRIRMQDLFTDPGVFIRSMGTRGHLGGIARATQAAVKAIDIFGKDYIFVETVGVGQSEVDIVKTADTVVMVMVPGLGDDIQAIKAGIMEIGDVFAINKSDRNGADKTKVELEMMLDFNEDKEWRPPISKVVAVNNTGISELINNVFDHKRHMKTSGGFERRRYHNIKEELLSLVHDRLMEMVLRVTSDSTDIDTVIQKILTRELDPYTASEQMASIVE